MMPVLAGDDEPMLEAAIDAHDESFVEFVIDHGLGPRWHLSTGRSEFHASRMAAESLYLAQERALAEIDAALGTAGIRYAVIKGVANRLLLYPNPAIRACHDIDLLVSPDDRLRVADALSGLGYQASPKAATISHELELIRGAIFVDLHWGLLREGRLPGEQIDDILSRRRFERGVWMLATEDSFFLLLVHPAFAKHLAGWDMGLHRVADIVDWIQMQPIDWDAMRHRLHANGVKTAAWATLRWVQLLISPRTPAALDEGLAMLRPGSLCRAYIDRWLKSDLSARTREMHWMRQFGFSLLLHDSLAGTIGALRGRVAAHRRRNADLAAFSQSTR